MALLALAGQALVLLACLQDGSYCNVSSSGGAGTGTCVANAANCGGIAKPCCVVNGRVGLLYTCNNGFFCPDPEDEGVVTSGGNGATTGSVMMAVVGPHDRACQECTPLVPTKYQVCVRSRMCICVLRGSGSSSRAGRLGMVHVAWPPQRPGVHSLPQPTSTLLCHCVPAGGLRIRHQLWQRQQ